MKEKKPWYVRLTEFLWENDSKYAGCGTPLIVLILLILISVISFNIAKNKPIEKSYEEAYDIEFKTYVNEILEEIFQTTVDEENRIILAEIPDVVLKYDISRTEQGIQLNYSLDKEKVISNYQTETGKAPIFSYSDIEDKFEMNIHISKDFKDVTKTYSIEIPTRDDYENTYPRLALLENTAFIAFKIGVLLITALVLLTILSIAPAIATCVWRRKQKKVKLS